MGRFMLLNPFHVFYVFIRSGLLLSRMLEAGDRAEDDVGRTERTAFRGISRCR